MGVTVHTETPPSVIFFTYNISQMVYYSYTGVDFFFYIVFTYTVHS